MGAICISSGGKESTIARASSSRFSNVASRKEAPLRPFDARGNVFGFLRELPHGPIARAQRATQGLRNRLRTRVYRRFILIAEKPA